MLAMRPSLSSSPIVVAFCLAVATAAVMGVAQPEKKAYLLVQVDVNDVGRYQEYGKQSPGIVAKFGGRYLARAGRTVTLEGPPAKARVVVIEFPSLARAQAFYHSPEYVEARKLREGAGDAQFVIVEGIE
jgi:uncharacterized protein (DUF1330 family)